MAAERRESYSADDAVAKIASAIGEPARARMLYYLCDGKARTSTELSVVADVSPSTASVHLQRLKSEHLVKLQVQGKHRYYSLASPQVAAALEALNVVAGGPRDRSHSRTPTHLRAARTCYDHIAGALGVALHDRLIALEWIGQTESDGGAGTNYDLTVSGKHALALIGIDYFSLFIKRRKFAYACLDWSERRPHIAGALGAALLDVFVKHKWVQQELDSRALAITRTGSRELQARFGLSTDFDSKMRSVYDRPAGQSVRYDDAHYYDLGQALDKFD
jgi:DNA-binding transcriptional ArsR family regulator